MKKKAIYPFETSDYLRNHLRCAPNTALIFIRQKDEEIVPVLN
jgi:hypothetical protein